MFSVSAPRSVFPENRFGIGLGSQDRHFARVSDGLGSDHTEKDECSLVGTGSLGGDSELCTFAPGGDVTEARWTPTCKDSCFELISDTLRAMRCHPLPTCIL